MFYWRSRFHFLCHMSLPQRFAFGFVLVWFIAGGIGHFTSAGHAFFVGIVPPYLTNASLLVYVSGAFELAGVVGLLIPRLRRYAGYGLMALVVAVSPANVHMWLHPELFPDFPRWVFAARLMFQLVLLWLIWWSCCRPSETDAA